MNTEQLTPATVSRRFAKMARTLCRENVAANLTGYPDTDTVAEASRRLGIEATDRAVSAFAKAYISELVELT